MPWATIPATAAITVTPSLKGPGTSRCRRAAAARPGPAPGSGVGSGPSAMYGRIVFIWSTERISPHAGMKMTPLVPGSGIEPSISTVRNSLSGTSSSGLRSAGTSLSAVLGFGAGGGEDFPPTCPWQSMQA